MSAVVPEFAQSSSRIFPSVDEFESGTLDPEAFDHEAHVYIAWRLLQENTFSVASHRFTSALRKLTRKLGIEGKYHETISWFYMVLIAERRSQQKRTDWNSFAEANPDLVSDAMKLLARYYSSERLWSSLAKRQFLLPDRSDLASVNRG
jgi:hypothetical protein